MSSKKNEPVITSFIKIAEEKGILSRESILDKLAKQPAAKKDLKPSDSFDQNLLTLCNALRERGFKTYAEELERKFTLYKSAETHLYRTHDEDGDDLVEFAHPEGDNKIAPAKNELGDVETIVSRHQKIVEVINKRPTGKLSEAAKYILGFKKEAVDTAQITKNVNLAVSNIDKLITQMLSLPSLKLQEKHFDPNVSDILSHPWTTITEHKSALFGLLPGGLGVIPAFLAQFIQKYSTSLKDLQEKLAADKEDFDNDMNIGNLDQIISRFDELKHFINSMPSDPEVIDIKSKIVEQIGKNKDFLTGTKNLYKGYESIITPSETSVPSEVSAPKDVATKLNEFETKIQSSAKFNDDQKKLILNWLDTKVKPLAESTKEEDKQRADKMLSAAEDKYKP